VVLDNFTSVREAVAALNARAVQCNDGYCVLHSLSKNRYFLIWRLDAEKVAFERFGLDYEHEDWGSSQSASSEGERSRATSSADSLCNINPNSSR
jgi:hypothetical protein